MNIHTLYGAIARRFRTRRMRDFIEVYQVTPETRILDVGGSLFNWHLIPFQPRLTIVNLMPPPASLPEHVEWIVTDGTTLPFDARSFDICYSNSVIEHLYSWDNQQQFAREIRRVANAYYVQTPNRRFPIEPHYLAPFIHWLPKGVQRKLLRRFTLWGWMTSPSPEKCRETVAEIRLLTHREMARLFPEARIQRETVLGLTKSLIAMWDARETASEKRPQSRSSTRARLGTAA